VILGRKGQGPLGVEWCESDFWVIDTAYFASTLTPDLDLKYFYHLVKHVGLNHLKDGTSNPTLSRDTFGAQLFPLPPLAEQKAIAAVLGALDDKIELNRRMNATLEATARALFQSWFVDFDPVRAKLDGRKPDGLDKPIAALFPAAFQDSPLGPIPKGWAVARLDDIASVMMGLSPDGDSYNSDGVGVPLINGPVEFGDYFPVKTKWTQASTRFAAEGDLIFCVRGSTTGRRVVSDGEYGIGRGVCAIRAKDKLDSLLYQTINVGLERLLEKTTGSVFPSLSAPDIKGFSVLKPNGDVQQLYERTTKPLVQSIQQNHRQSRTLATLRDTLLPKLLSGEVSVGDARRYAGDII
jgi:type I restriction enzyme S subunit